MPQAFGCETAASRLAFGTMALTDLYNPAADLHEGEAALALALDSGVTMFHTAAHYGDGSAMTMLRRALSGAAAATTVCVKIEGSLARLFDGPEGIDSSLRLLGRECIEFAQIVESQDEVADRVTIEQVYAGLRVGAELRQSLETARRGGKIRMLGAEAYMPHHVREAIACGLDFVVCDQSIIRHVINPRATPPAITSGAVKFLAIRPLAGGWLTPRYVKLSDFATQDRRRAWYAAGAAARPKVQQLCNRYRIDIYSAAMRFLLSRPYPHWIALGMRSVNQVQAALDPRLMTPLPSNIDSAFQDLFDQPFALEP
jgi:aryl-alcohol dehydrogenase-like predicted oxidoreductase